MENVPTSHKKWYQKSVGIIALLILFFPAGLYLMWKYSGWNKIAMWLITGFFGLMILGSMASGDSKTSTTTAQPTQAPQATVEPTQPQVVNTSPAPTKVPVKATTAPVQPKQSSGTVSQKNAVSKAKSYLNYTGFSHDGLVAQLEYEQFSNADAVYGADNSGGNWNNEAAQKAKAYMEYSAFSRGSLIEQLKYDKFTQEQAEYGANSVGL